MSWFDDIFSTPVPRVRILFSKESQNEAKEKFRKKVDEVISPESDLGRVIHKARKMVDKQEEKQENRENAPQNLFYIGEVKKDFQLADHLFIRLGPITHHAIYVGADRVIHYSTVPDGELHVQYATLEEFSEGREVQCLSETESPLKYTRSEAVSRAKHRLGEHQYHFFENNCEAFVRWCRNGGKESVWEED